MSGKNKKHSPSQVEFYSAFFGLTPRERHYLEVLTEDDDNFRELLRDSANTWHEYLRKHSSDNIECRKRFMAGSLLYVAENSAKALGTRRLALALVVYMADAVEKIVQ